ncbi:hypothetical protein G6F46_000171 [Rhizopus delemar]|uniref:Guanine nucleotide-binding protein-like 3 N-terminal domain-containing protein n=3 Tax=Rhizopus TaxID=4842 RepID=I1C2R0_RHIO9|nr:hypothetical protein RO3G_07445 [Rhizopus delemar RA 99-880]KAG1058016.1 hypothetical protein G6F43_000174 [Rhizopus delemar]KAG1553911.1 hypothetical protein G6F51_000288 [Rhizopus arrhizus]KAG1467120.1 hypothetical protein G6F55_000043 [Rhizopus delemar]KAG1504986.1 hypothetical protein G6F54_000616 [Rhizopus delemar]|eukprot:EIE82740.1 hypothetical protein RO3G_07445 [Rhizopus delemar RA 99-880]
MVPKKRQSKRVRMAHRYRIAGRIKDHQRKERRGEKKNPKSYRKSKKDPGIPNNWPFKEELLNEVEKQRQEAEEEKRKKKEMNKKKKKSPVKKETSIKEEEVDSEEAEIDAKEESE